MAYHGKLGRGCRVCLNYQIRQRRASDRDGAKKLRDSTRRYAKKNRKKMTELVKKWAKANPNKIREYERRYLENLKNRPEAQERRRRRRRNAELARRAKQAVAGKYTDDEVWQMYEDQNGLCAYCEIPLFGGFQVEHMTPISRGGRNDWTNIAIACQPCNSLKHTLTAEEFFG